MSRTLKIVIPVVLVIALAVGGGLWWFLRDDAPAEVDLDTAAESVTPAAGDTGNSSIGRDDRLTPCRREMVSIDDPVG